MLVLAGLVLRAPARVRVGAGVLIGAGLLLPGPVSPPEQLEVVETPYQVARVLEGDGGMRLLAMISSTSESSASRSWLLRLASLASRR